MTKEQAEYVKLLRCGPRIHSWRRIAELYEDKYKESPILHGNQLHGQDLCREAAELLGEDPNSEAWN